jgi:class 3 adenylate cyclase
VSVTGPTTPPAADEIEAELRRLTVMFADMQGSTALIGQIDPEQAAELIDPALTVMIAGAERYDGVVSSRGDGIMAVFGAQARVEDHAIRACLAALAIRDELMRRAGGEVVPVRIGIHSGDVVFRSMRIGGVAAPDVVGIAVHIAARLEQSAVPGMICLSEEVLRAVRGFVRTAPIEPVAMKGLNAPVRRHRLDGIERGANRWAVRAAKGLVQFVNRVEEFAVLRRLRAASGLRVAHIVGEAGLGKSRLLHEFVSEPATQAMQRVQLVGDVHHRDAPFHPIAAWLRAWFDMRDSDTRADALEKLNRGLATMPDGAQIDRDLLVRVLDLGTVGTEIAGPKGLPELDFGGAFAALLRHVAGARPLLLTCEDFDGFDAASRELIATTLARLQAAEVFVVTTSRLPVAIEAVATASTHMLRLAPLDDAHAARLLTGLDPTMTADAPLARLIIRKAGGNPLFLEEVAPAAAQAEFAPSRPVAGAAIAIPDSIDALIAERLARLPMDLRRLVQRCAVIGMDIPVRIAAALAGDEHDALHAKLLRLQDEEVVYESRKYPDPQFSFRHALIRDVAYGTILAAQRRRHHARIVEALLAEDEESQTRNIADLCEHAIQARLWPQAIGFLRHAARQAAARGAHEVARATLVRARAYAAEQPDDDDTARLRLDILQELRHLTFWAGDYAAINPILDEAEALAQTLRDPRQAEIIAFRMHVLNLTGTPGAAIALGERIRRSPPHGARPDVQVVAALYTAQSYFNAGRVREAERVYGETLRVIAGMLQTGAADDEELVHRLCQTYGTRAMTRAMAGDFPGADADIDAMSRIVQPGGLPYDRILFAAAKGFVDFKCRRIAAADTAFRHCLALSDQHDIAQLRAPVLAMHGLTLLLHDDLIAARETLECAYQLTGRAGRAMFQSCAAAGLAWVALREGDLAKAAGFANDAVALAERFGFRSVLVLALRTRGVICGSIADAEAGLRVARALGLRPDIALTHAALAYLDAAAREAHLKRAERAFLRLGMQDWSATVAGRVEAGDAQYV